MLKIGILYGGRSGEHEISLRSARSVIDHLNPEQYDIIPIAIDRDGVWRTGSLETARAEEPLSLMNESGKIVWFPPWQSNDQPALHSEDGALVHLDAVFPVLHGPFYEDGAIQGYLTLAKIPFVGAAVLGSAVGMDKTMTKRLSEAAGVAVARDAVVTASQWAQNQTLLQEAIRERVELPLFVKPANQGSSVGIRKVESWDALSDAITFALKFDHKVLVEQGVHGRELEVAVLEDAHGNLRASLPGEIVPRASFYSYDAKYLDDDGADLLIPAELEATQIDAIQSAAMRVFAALDLEGMARVDFFLEYATGAFCLNEVNTIPGFTSISMYPKLFEASGLPYAELLDALIQHAIHRSKRDEALSRVRED